MHQAEQDAHKVEFRVRQKTQQLKYLLETKEKELVQQVHRQKQQVLSRLVSAKIELEDFKLKEQFPIKLFEILEEKLHAKELSLFTILSQTKYFKRLLEQTYTMRKSQSQTLIDQEGSETRLSLTVEAVEKSMHEVGEFLDK